MFFFHDFSVSEHVLYLYKCTHRNICSLSHLRGWGGCYFCEMLLYCFQSWQPIVFVFLGRSARTTTTKHNKPTTSWIWNTSIPSAHPCCRTSIHPCTRAERGRGSQCGEWRNNKLTVIVFIHIERGGDRTVQQKVCPVKTSRIMWCECLFFFPVPSPDEADEAGCCADRRAAEVRLSAAKWTGKGEKTRTRLGVN